MFHTFYTLSIFLKYSYIFLIHFYTLRGKRVNSIQCRGSAWSVDSLESLERPHHARLELALGDSTKGAWRVAPGHLSIPPGDGAAGQKFAATLQGMAEYL